jgi:hypothetical protein
MDFELRHSSQITRQQLQKIQRDKMIAIMPRHSTILVQLRARFDGSAIGASDFCGTNVLASNRQCSCRAGRLLSKSPEDRMNE